MWTVAQGYIFPSCHTKIYVFAKFLRASKIDQVPATLWHPTDSKGFESMSGTESSFPCIEIRILFFARARELCGTSSTCVKVHAGVTAVDVLLDTVLKLYPKLEPLIHHCALAVNLEYVPGLEENIGHGNRPVSTVLQHGDELAIIPPISGG